MNNIEIISLDKKFPLYFEMSNSEKICLYSLLQEIKPRVSIEIGTKGGGSLQYISKWSEKVYSIDIDPSVKNSLASKFSNVEFITGDSKKVLPELFERINQLDESVDFILIDGDHSTEGVKNDIDNIFKHYTSGNLVVIMHDSFNPACRKGMLSANYNSRNDIEYIDLNFINGTFSPSKDTLYEMWGGFGILKFNNTIGSSNLSNLNKSNESYNSLLKLSKHGFLESNSLFDKLKFKAISLFWHK